jgi:hypothetical protein
MGWEEAAAGVRATLAFAIAAPEGSVTCPRNAPEAGCAAFWDAPVWGEEDWAAANVAQAYKETTNVKHRYFRKVIQYSNP